MNVKSSGAFFSGRPVADSFESESRAESVPAAQSSSEPDVRSTAAANSNTCCGLRLRGRRRRRRDRSGLWPGDRPPTYGRSVGKPKGGGREGVDAAAVTDKSIGDSWTGGRSRGAAKRLEDGGPSLWSPSSSRSPAPLSSSVDDRYGGLGDDRCPCGGVVGGGCGDCCCC